MKPLLIFSCISSPVFSVCIFSCRGGQTINALIDLIILSLDDMMFQWLYIGSVTKKKDVQREPVFVQNKLLPRQTLERITRKW